MISKIYKHIYTSIIYYCQLQCKNFRHNIHQFLIAFDQMINALVGVLSGSKSWADETFSCRCYRWRNDGIRAWPANFVDALLFFDKEDGKAHCELSYINEQNREQSPPELRSK